MDPPPVLRPTLPVLATALAAALCTAACGGARPAGAPAALPRTTSAAVALPEAAHVPEAAPGHWYFEWLSRDGKRALLRRLDGEARTNLQTRVVDVDSGKVLVDDTFPELGKLPTATIGRRPNEVAELMGRLAAPALGEDVVRAAALAEGFPFGSCGRLSSAAEGGAIAFNAGDWLYVADGAGRVQKRVTAQAAYDPRFTPDGKFVMFRGATGKIDKVRARYELLIAPADLSRPARVLAGTAGVRDRFSVDAAGAFAVAVASQEPQVKTCVLSIGLRSPFAVKRLACLDGAEQFVDSTLSPGGRWAAITTQKSATDAASRLSPEWRLRVVALVSGDVVLDQAAAPGLLVRAISDDGVLVQSGAAGVVIDDLEAKTHRTLARDVELGHRGLFRSPSELVVVRGGSVAVVDLAKE